VEIVDALARDGLQDDIFVRVQPAHDVWMPRARPAMPIVEPAAPDERAAGVPGPSPAPGARAPRARAFRSETAF
jgi:hypothetical protein